MKMDKEIKEMLGENTPLDWGIADKTEWVASQPFEGEAKMPALEGRDVVGFSEPSSVSFASYIPDQIKQAAAGLPNYTYTDQRTGHTYKKKGGHWSVQQNGVGIQDRMGANVDSGKIPKEHIDQPRPKQEKAPQPSPATKQKAPASPQPERDLDQNQLDNIERAQKEIKEGTSDESFKKSESFNAGTTRSNEEFLADPPHDVVRGKPFVDIRKRLTETGLFDEGFSAPPKYLDLLSQLGVTQAKGVDGPPVSDFIEGAGAGAPMSQAGELMMMMSSSMSDEQADAFFDILKEVGDGTSVVNDGWVVAAQRNRAALQRAIINNLGGGTVVAAAWDVRKEVEELGLNYKDKGFSTDAFFRVRRDDGTEVIFEASLKKDKNVFFINGGATSLAEESINAMPDNHPVKAKLREIDASLQELRDKYNNGNNFTKAKLKYPSKGNEEELEKARSSYENLSRERDSFLREHTNPYNTDVYMDGLVDGVYQPCARELLKNKDQLNLLLDLANKKKIDLNKYAKKLGAKSVEEALEIIAKTPAEGSTANHKKLLAKVLEAANKHGSDSEILTKYGKELTDRYDSYRRNLSSELAKEGPLRTAVISRIRQEFPLKAVLNGEEVMCIGDVNFDLKTAERVFGTTDINQINQKLKIVIDKKGSPVLVYSAGQEGEEIPIALITARQRGIGYESMGFEASLHNGFYDKVQQAVIMENLDGKPRRKYMAKDKKAGLDPKDSQFIQAPYTFDEAEKKPTYEDYLKILRSQRSSQKPSYSDSMVFYKGKALGRCPSGTTRSGKTCVPSASSANPAAKYKNKDIGGIAPQQIKALSKAKSMEDVLKAHKNKTK